MRSPLPSPALKKGEILSQVMDFQSPSYQCVSPQVSSFHPDLQVALEKFPNKLQHFRRVWSRMTPLTMTLPSYPFTSAVPPLLVTILIHKNSDNTYADTNTKYQKRPGTVSV